MRTISLLQPPKIVSGRGCEADCAADLLAAGARRVLVVTSPPLTIAANRFAGLLAPGATVEICDLVAAEPTIERFEGVRSAARRFECDTVVGLGGGSALDVAKLVAAMAGTEQDVRRVFGINLLGARGARLVCLPTTSGTGSEVSPNAILTDETEQLKKGVVSPFLVPDAAYIDPLLTVSMPPTVTASTGMDALTHCIEAYTNKFAHPLVDVYALEGIRRIASSLATAVKDGADLDARESMALGSMYGGLCLGPVNTAAVHALAYPLGGEFHVPHGLSNAVLLPSVMEFNLPACPERFANVAEAMGVEPCDDQLEKARRGVEAVRRLSRECGTDISLSRLGIADAAIPRLAESAMKVTRLTRNNPRELTWEAAVGIYRAAHA
ncbi:MAG TPA: iron-containing alcohol dehydrogenase [Candidatus Solibacter sp.]|nr:iron-containing alcohol dehydrogenase [Candidatus Solibacter sp.]